MIKEIDDQVTIKMSEPGWEYPAELWKSVYVSVFNILEMSLKLANYREEILQIWRQMTLLVTEAQTAAFFKEVYKECYEIFKGQVTQSGLSFIKRVQWMREQLNMIIGQEGYEYSNIIHEYLSIKSRFTKNERYVTLKNDFISQAMWMKIWVIQQEYHHLNSEKNLTSLINLMKFNYLESIESKTKN